MENLVRKRRLDAISEDGQSKRCSVCGFTKLLKDFNKNKITKDGYQGTCRDCTQEQDRKRLLDPQKAQEGRERALKFYYNNQKEILGRNTYRQIVLKIRAINELGAKCEECGEEHPATLQFHHRNPEEKEFSLSTKTLSATKLFPWEIILKEIQKCQLLCANCHAKLHSTWTEDAIKEAKKYIKTL